MSRRKHILFALLLLLSFGPRVFAQKPNDLQLDNNQLILLLDLHSSPSKLDSLLQSAGIEHVDGKKIKNGDYSSLRKLGWNVLQTEKNLLRIQRSLADVTPGNAIMYPAILNQKDTRPGYPAERPFGVNNFARISVHELPNGITRFFLPGYTRVKRVMLAGNFNNWSTSQVMLKTDSGWIKDVSLEPGVYAYKFIADGRWGTDPNNNLRENDGAGNINSIYYRYNFSFKLNGYPDAHRVVLTGSFNKWDPGQLIMNHNGNGWEIKLYLHDGMHLYHFLVDGRPVADPDNRLTGKEVSGNKTSLVKLGESFNFKLNGYENAEQGLCSRDF